VKVHVDEASLVDAELATLKVERGLTELVAVTAGDQWAEDLVQTSAWMHLDGSPLCLGYVMASSGRAFCGRCQWQLSGRLDDLGSLRSGRFAMFVLAWIGMIVGIAAAEDARR
jgi:hypothetical protein